MSMSLPVFTPDWVRAWTQLIRESEEYRNAAAGWEGSLLLLLPEQGSGAFLDLRRGECREGRAATPEDRNLADFVISGDASTWKAVLEGDLEPLTGVATGRLRLEKGSMTTLVMHAGAAKALVATARGLDTVFPDQDQARSRP
jgi:putative sterol carrier protein